jgi:glycosyltransferase involved in cell wall biosynthesis
VTQGANRERLALQAIALGYPTILRIVTVGCAQAVSQYVTENADAAELLRGCQALMLSDSCFIATKVRDLVCVDSPVLYELIRFNEIRADYRCPAFITFVNPCPPKGLDIALQLARLLPDREFLFVESWPLDIQARRDLKRTLRSLPNVTLRSRSMNMKEVYGCTAVLVVPSRWEEAFGRVIVEAAANGIPVLASRIGGIPEAMGDSGVLLPLEDEAKSWELTLRAILSNNDLYGRLSEKAVVAAERPELDPDNITDRFLQLVVQHIQRSRVMQDLQRQ